MFKFILGILRGIFSGVLGDLMKPGFSAFAGLTSKLSMFMFHTAVRMAPEEAKQWMEKAIEYYYTPDEEWIGFVEAYMSKLTGKDIRYEELTAGDLVGGGRQAAEDLGETFLHPMLGLIMPGAEGPPGEAKITPQDGIDAAERFLGVNLRFQMQAWLLHLIGDIKSFGMWKALKDLPNAISWSYGIGWLSWLVMGVPFRMGISVPLEEYYNRLYRPARLSLAKVADAYNMGEITPEETRDLLEGMGWSDELITLILKLERKKLTKAEAKALWSHGFLSLEEYAEFYHEQGYTPSEAETLAYLESTEEDQKLIGKIAAEAFNLYTDELLDESTLRDYLTQAGYTTEQITLHLALAALKRIEPPLKERAPRRLTPANAARKYQKGQWNYDTTYTKLLELNFYEPDIHDFLELYEPDIPKVEEPRELTTSLIGSLYKRQELNTDQATALWLELDWTPERIPYLLKYYAPIPPKPPEPKPPYLLSVSTIGRLYQVGAISDTEAIERMALRQVSETDARLLLETTYAPLPPEIIEPRMEPTGVVGGLFKRGEIDSTAAYNRFIELGYGVDAAKALVLYYTPE